MFSFFKKKNNFDTATFSIDGMHCTSCSMNIDGELEELEGVQSASTSYAKATTRVEYDSKKVSEQKIIQTINKLGYMASVRS